MAKSRPPCPPELRQRMSAGLRAAMRWPALIALVAGSALAAPAATAAPGPPSAAAAADPACEPVEGVAALPSDRMILFGEMHGTDRSPEAFGAVACHLARGRGELVVGLEISHTEQERIDRFLAGDGGEEARRHLLAGDFWNTGSQDGRQSRAMLELIESLRRLRQQGVGLEVVAFDPIPGIALADREEHMARRLAAARERHPREPFLVLTGNLHPRTAVGVPWDAEFVPMGARLERAGVAVWSVDLRHAGGTAWVCLAGEDGCAPRRIEGSGPPREQLLLEPFAEPEATGYQAALWVGLVEASPPAVEALR